MKFSGSKRNTGNVSERKQQRVFWCIHYVDSIT